VRDEGIDQILTCLWAFARMVSTRFASPPNGSLLYGFRLKLTGIVRFRHHGGGVMAKPVAVIWNESAEDLERRYRAERDVVLIPRQKGPSFAGNGDPRSAATKPSRTMSARRAGGC